MLLLLRTCDRPWECGGVSASVRTSRGICVVGCGTQGIRFRTAMDHAEEGASDPPPTNDGDYAAFSMFLVYLPLRAALLSLARW